jgi:hypothetical protein
MISGWIWPVSDGHASAKIHTKTDIACQIKSQLLQI